MSINPWKSQTLSLSLHQDTCLGSKPCGHEDPGSNGVFRLGWWVIPEELPTFSSSTKLRNIGLCRSPRSHHHSEYPLIHFLLSPFLKLWQPPAGKDYACHTHKLQSISRSKAILGIFNIKKKKLTSPFNLSLVRVLAKLDNTQIHYNLLEECGLFFGSGGDGVGRYTVSY